MRQKQLIKPQPKTLAEALRAIDELWSELNERPEAIIVNFPTLDGDPWRTSRDMERFVEPERKYTIQVTDSNGFRYEFKGVACTVTDAFSEVRS